MTGNLRANFGDPSVYRCIRTYIPAHLSPPGWDTTIGYLHEYSSTLFSHSFYHQWELEVVAVERLNEQRSYSLYYYCIARSTSWSPLLSLSLLLSFSLSGHAESGTAEVIFKQESNFFLLLLLVCSVSLLRSSPSYSYNFVSIVSYCCSIGRPSGFTSIV